MIWHQLDRQLDVWREVMAPDGSGGRKAVWAYVGVAWGMVSQPNANERVLAEQAGSEHDHLIYFASDQDVRRRDRLRDAVADPSIVDAETKPYFDVISTIAPSRSDVYLRSECVLIQAERSR